MKLKWSKSMREAGGPSFFLIDVNVSVLAPGLNSIETVLQLSENIVLFAIRGIHRSVIGKQGQKNA
jgi:hypothetical protein